MFTVNGKFVYDATAKRPRSANTTTARPTTPREEGRPATGTTHGTPFEKFVYVPRGKTSRTGGAARTKSTPEYVPFKPYKTTIGQLIGTADVYVVSLGARTMTLRGLKRVSTFLCVAMMKTGPERGFGQPGPNYWVSISFAPEEVVTSWDPLGPLPELKEEVRTSTIVFECPPAPTAFLYEPPDLPQEVAAVVLDQWADDGGPPIELQPAGPDVVTITPPLPANGRGSQQCLDTQERLPVADMTPAQFARLFEATKFRHSQAEVIEDYERFTPGQKGAATRQFRAWLDYEDEMDELGELATCAYA